MAKRLLAIFLSLVTLLGVVPYLCNITETKAASGLADGTVVYYEDFNYTNATDNTAVLSALGWSLAEEYRTNTTNYSISGGKLLCDSTTSTATTDSYVTVLDDTSMSEVAKGDYTISYKLNYLAATEYTKYACLVYNYNGYKSYNTVNLRVAGFGYNQVRAYSWYHYDDSTSAYYMPATGTSSISYKLFGVSAATANASTSTGYPMVGRELTVRIAVDIDAGATVYVNGVKVSAPATKYKEQFLASQEYASAIALKTTAGVKAYMDDLVVYTGLGDIPTGITKDSVTYQPPQATDKGTTIKAMSYNVYYISQSTAALGDGLNRSTHMYNVINGYHPDILGLQERTEANKSGITSMLISSGGYAVADEYRTDTTVSSVHHHAPILYNTSRLTLESNTAANNYMGHGALLYKDCYEVMNLTSSQWASFSPGKSMSWAVFKDKQSGSFVLAMNTHFSLYLSSYTNYTTQDAINDRLSNAAECMGVMEKVFAVYGNIPVIYTGDFNMRSNDPSYKYIVSKLSDTLYANDDFTRYEFSMNSITSTDFVQAPNMPIDHIFYSSEALSAVDYKICNGAPEIRIASDHLPVLATFTIEEAVAPICSHSTGIYSGTQSVRLTGDGALYYTTDGSDPRSSDTRKLYPGVISVTEDTVLKYCAYTGGVFSNVERVTLYFGNPIYITEVNKNSPGTDLCEGIEVINVSSVPLDLFDFIIWNYSDAAESSCASVASSSVTLQMKMGRVEGEYVVPPGGVAFCPTTNSTMYTYKEQYSATESGYLVTLNEDGTKVNYHTDKWAAAIAYDGAGNISPDMIFPIDRTARSMGYAEDGTLIKRSDYYSTTGSTINNTTASFNLSNSAYTKLYITFNTAQSVASAITSCYLDGTDGGTTTATDGTTTVLAGSYHFLPSGSTMMTTDSFTENAYTIGTLTSTQQKAFGDMIAKRHGVASVAISTAEEFAAMSASGSYYLTADISLSASYATKFTGVLDGMGHTITTTVPLFTDFSGTVKNLNVTGEINGNGGYNGAIAPQSTGDARLENISVNATLTGGTVTGGLIGYSADGADIIALNCVNNGDISGTKQTGGLFGYVLGTSLVIEGCSNKGKISSDTYSGGLVSRFGVETATIGYYCNITNSANYGEVVASTSRAGGILAYSVGDTRIAGCVNYGYIHYSSPTTNFMAGGIFGAGSVNYTAADGTTVDTANALTVSDCHNYGKVEATTNAGGIVGRISNHAPASGYSYTISNCGNTGEIISTDAGSTYGTKGAGGIVGYLYGGSSGVNGIFNCYNLGTVKVIGGTNGVAQRACGIAAYVSGTKTYLKNCYNAGSVSASGNDTAAYQLFYNNNETGSGSSYISNNHAIIVSGAAYELNGTQAASYKTFTEGELAAGTVKTRLNSGAGKVYYYQSSTAYPVLKEYDNNLKNGIVLKSDATYTEDGVFVYKIAANTSVDSFKESFLTEVKVYGNSGEAPVATGWQISSYDGTKTMTLVVRGDLDGNGTVSATDYINIKSYIKTGTGLNTAQRYAADMDDNAQISASDYLSLKLMLMLAKN